MNSASHKLMLARRRGARAASAMAVVTAAATLLVVAGPASANLSPGTGWTKATLPAGLYTRPGSTEPVSCAPGTRFCVAIVPNDAQGGLADVVTTDQGQHWAGYTDLPGVLGQIAGISCVSESVCWVAGQGVNGSADVAKTTDGGQTWTDMTPPGWLNAYFATAIDCVTAADCWVGGVNTDPVKPQPNNGTPWMANTTDGGATWTVLTNLPQIAQYDPNGYYQINAISCTSATDCVAAGGLDEADGLAQVITTTDAGATWTLSTDPTLMGVQDIFSLSCLPGPDGLPVCNAAADALEAAGPVEITSTDGGATWSGMETYDVTGWLSSVSCPDTQHCWATGGGTSVALVGTINGGATWSEQTAETTNENGGVSCASVNFCVTTTDNAVWSTTDGGGLTATADSSPQGTTARKPVTLHLPRFSGGTVWARTGYSVRLVGQYRGAVPAKTASVRVKLPDGILHAQTVAIGRNHYYSLTISKVAPGSTKVTFTAGNASPYVVRVHSHAGRAPTITAMSVHAGPAAGGNELTVTGTGFSHITRVLFGSTPATHVEVTSATRLTVRAPAGAGDRYLTVVTSGGGPSPLTGRAVYNWLRRPVLTRLSPASGRASGGTTVKIIGANLAFIRRVYFGKNKGTHLEVLSPREIKIVAPAGHGTVSVRIVTAGGTTSLVRADRFTY